MKTKNLKRKQKAWPGGSLEPIVGAIAFDLARAYCQGQMNDNWGSKKLKARARTLQEYFVFAAKHIIRANALGQKP